MDSVNCKYPLSFLFRVIQHDELMFSCFRRFPYHMYFHKPNRGNDQFNVVIIVVDMP